ncbi:MAG: hypothetical protein E7420_06625 [Ruminococcaceae bacterium]|nr:hypothetical protein [Oscillospiraceae bacterium]
MAKYCIKCGKALPEGVEVCPDCNIIGQSESDAALFTKLTSSADAWRESEEEERKILRRAENFHKNRKTIIIAVICAVLAIAILFLVLFNLPASRVVRALDRGEYVMAQGIWHEKMDEDDLNERIEEKLLEEAQKLCDALAARKMSDTEVKSAMDALYSFGGFTKELFAPIQKTMDALLESSGNMALGGMYFATGDYLKACDSYRLVLENDALYGEAQAKAQEALDAYAASVIDDASVLIAENEYTAAIECLKAGDRVLGDYGTFSTEIDGKIQDCYRLYETYILVSAEALAKTEDYLSAKETVRVCVEEYGYSTEALAAALEQYSVLAEKQLVTSTLVSAETLYTSGKYAEAFKVLDEIVEKVSGEYKTQAQNGIVEFETRFGKDMCAKADEKYGGDRGKVAAAIADLEAALEIRNLDTIKDKIAELEPLLPLDLISEAYSKRVGEVNRNSTEFTAIEGTKYHKWMWGRDEANIEFSLDANYDVFEAIFAFRGSSDDKKSAYFDIYLDGEKVYTSETLSAGSENPVVPVKVDVGGAKLMKIVFHCDYEASPGQNGYSYHAICVPEVYKQDK